MKHLFFLSFLSLGLASKSYENYQIVRVPSSNDLDSVLEKANVNVVGHVINGVDILVAPENLDWLQKTFQDFQVIDPNLQHSIDEEKQLIEAANQEEGADYFKSYHTFDEMHAWYKDLAKEYKDLVTFVPAIGKSIEGREIFALKITGKEKSVKKPQLWIQGQIHAREWISGITVQYILNELLSNYGKDSQATQILDKAELLVVPIQNPDGYEYTWKSDRMWRKNRNGNGVDLNRNWNDHWGGQGSSGSPSSDTYRGKSAFSEPETKAVSSFMLQHKNIVGAIDFHSYSELLLRPAGWTTTNQPFEAEHRKLGEDMNNAIKGSGRGKLYQNIKSAELYIACGTASDWFYGDDVYKNQGFRPYAYTIELSPSGGGFGQGFILPPSEIIPVGREISAAFRIFADRAISSPLKSK